MREKSTGLLLLLRSNHSLSSVVISLFIQLFLREESLVTFYRKRAEGVDGKGGATFSGGKYGILYCHRQMICSILADKICIASISS
jgi:hypothetical protein